MQMLNRTTARGQSSRDATGLWDGLGKRRQLSRQPMASKTRSAQRGIRLRHRRKSLAVILPLAVGRFSSDPSIDAGR